MLTLSVRDPHPAHPAPARSRAADPRPARTRAAIYAAVRQLSEAGGELSVNDIVRRAGVSRASFYAHFSNLEDVGTAMVADMFAHLEDIAVDAEKEGITASVRAAVRAAAELVVDNRAFFRGAAHWRISHSAYARVARVLEEYWLLTFQLLGAAGPPVADRPALARFLAGGTLRMYVGWTLDDANDAVEREDAVRELADSVLLCLPASVVGTIEPVGGDSSGERSASAECAVGAGADRR